MSRKDDHVSPGRRTFLRRVWLLLAGLAGVEFGWISYRALKWKSHKVRETELVGTIVAGNVSKFLPGSVTPFPQGKFYLVCLDDGGFLALSRRCPHLNCSVPWVEDQRQFVCPCHGSVFDLRGEVLRPPAPRPLDLLHVRIEDNIVKVDAGQVLKRDSFDSSQTVRV